MEIAINIAGWVIAVLGLAFSVYQHRLSEKRLAAQLHAEKELRDLRSRGEGPYLSPCDQLCGHIYEQTDKGVDMWSSTGTNILWFRREEVTGLNASDPVILLLQNNGCDARRITINTSLKNCTIKQEPAFSGSHGHIFLKYNYEPAQHGKPIQLAISFEAHSGFQDTHVYETIHGRRVFTRVKP